MRPLALLVLVAACEEDPVPATCMPEPTPAQPWCNGPALTERRLEAGIAEHGTRIAVVGGFTESFFDITPEVLSLDTLTRQWSRLSELPVAWTHANVASAGATLFVLGGLEGHTFVPRGEAFALDLDTTVWRVLPSMPEGLERGAAAVVASPPHLYLLGGDGAAGATASCLVYNLATSTWSSLPDLPFARSHAAAMRRFDGTLIVAGGIGAGGLPLGDVWSLAPGAEAWEPRESMPTKRGGCAHGVALGQLVCAGGEAGPSVLSVVESYDPVSDEWRTWPAMPAPRAGSRGAVVGQRLYVPGGSAGAFQGTTTVFVFSLLDALSAATE